MRRIDDRSRAQVNCGESLVGGAEFSTNGRLLIGELAIQQNPDAFVFCHREDEGRSELREFSDAEVALEISRFDDDDRYRPLKTAPNLRRGWKLAMHDREAAQLALDHFYPGRREMLSAWKLGGLTTTPFRETLARQTGMYRAASKILDEAADKLISNFCRSEGGCLRTILWKRDGEGAPASSLLPAAKFDPAVDQTGAGEKAAPLLCQEACNLLVAAARKVVKKSA